MTDLSPTPSNVPITDRSFEIYREHFSILAYIKDMKVLDIGCGNSVIGDELRSNGNYYVGIDAQSCAGRTVAGDAEKLPFIDDAFDVVIALYSLPQWAKDAAQINRFVKECGRVAKQHILIAPDEPSEYSEGGFSTMEAKDSAFRSSISQLVLMDDGWTQVPITSRTRVTHLKKA